MRGLESLRDGEKGLGQNMLFSPARDIDGLRSSGEFVTHRYWLL